jgi:signal transduction histidine kinase
MARTDSTLIGATMAVEGPAVDAQLRVDLAVARLLREREAARAQAADLARDYQRLETFLSIACHELRGPATSGSLGVQLAAQRLDVLRQQAMRCDAALADRLAAVQDVLERAANSLDRLTRLVCDLLDVSRLQSGQLAVQPAPADLRAVVRAAVDEQRQLAPTRRIRLHLPARQAGQAILVWADADRIHQVVTNLITNALKYAPADRPVDVRVQVRAGWARVGVRDQGPGLPPEEQRRIWEAFHRADGIAVTSGTPHGCAQSLGLGLYISKTIIEQHHGEVGVRSTPGQGATFWFTLPVIPADRLARDEPPPAAVDAA